VRGRGKDIDVFIDRKGFGELASSLQEPMVSAFASKRPGTAFLSTTVAGSAVPPAVPPAILIVASVLVSW